MSSGMSLLRKEDLSLYLYIKDIVLTNFREVEEYSDLSLMPELSSSNSYVYECVYNYDIPYPYENGRGFVYFDDEPSYSCSFTSVSGLNGDGYPAFGIPEQSTKLTLYETTASGLQVVDWKDYMIDYTDCRIVSYRELNSPKLTYTWNYVSVVDEWNTVNTSNTPVVAIGLDQTNKMGYQLGGGKLTNRRVDLHIFASNQAERNDIVEKIYDGLFDKSCQILDFNSGTVLDYDGTFYGRKTLLDRIPDPEDQTSYLFDTLTVDKVSKLRFDNVTAKNVSLPLIMSTSQDNVVYSDINAYRAIISFDMYSYDDRNI